MSNTVGGAARMARVLSIMSIMTQINGLIRLAVLDSGLRPARPVNFP